MIHRSFGNLEKFFIHRLAIWKSFLSIVWQLEKFFIHRFWQLEKFFIHRSFLAIWKSFSFLHQNSFIFPFSFFLEQHHQTNCID